MPQHRLIAECYMGVLLMPSQVVHHKNRDKADNRWENLQVMDRRDHSIEHAADIRDANLRPIDHQQVQTALIGRTTLEAAKILGVNHNTLRNRFDYLLTKRRSPGDGFPLETVALASELARDPHIGTRRACEILDMAPLTLRALCRIHGIVWVSAPLGRPKRDQR